jgi:hypothetical protein
MSIVEYEDPFTFTIPPVSFDGYGKLRCPECGRTNGVHVDFMVATDAAGNRVAIIASGEDDRSRLDVSSGQCRNVVEETRFQRRHTFTLLFWCENCRPNELGQMNFRQHKGDTYVWVGWLPGRTIDRLGYPDD